MASSSTVESMPVYGKVPDVTPEPTEDTCESILNLLCSVERQHIQQLPAAAQKRQLHDIYWGIADRYAPQLSPDEVSQEQRNLSFASSLLAGECVHCAVVVVVSDR